MIAEPLKHSDEAIALLTLYRAMKPEIKEDVKGLIVQEAGVEETTMPTELSFNK